MKRAAAWLAGVTAALLACAPGCNGKTTTAGGLELIIATDMQTPQDFDTLHVEISQRTAQQTWNRLLTNDFAVPAEKHLPATISIAAGSSADQEVLIDVVALKGGPVADGGHPIVLREAEVQVPRDRVAELYFLLSAACAGQVTLTAGVATSTCGDPTQSCQPSTGACGTSTIDPSTLPNYTPADINGPDAQPEPEASPDSTVSADGSDAANAPDTTLGDDVVETGPGSDVVETGPAGDVAEAGPAVPPASEGGPVDGASTCSMSGPCSAVACHTAAYVCEDGGAAVCAENGTLPDGTSCGTGAGFVCSGGNCVACNQGGDCSDAGAPCTKLAYVCSTGAPVCTAMGTVTDGTSCGAGMYCNGGVCSTCMVGAGCTPTGQPCHKGSVTACTGTVATCTDSFMAGNSGGVCAADKVCSSGQCVTQLTVSGGAPSATQAVLFTGTVGTVTDANTADPATALTVTIGWGDGTASSAGSISGGQGSFTVSGTHTYATSGSYSGTISVSDSATGSLATGTFTASVGMCVPTSKGCSGNTPQLCSAAGQWQNQSVCANGFTCSAGACACSLATCGTSCVDPMTNTSNCGTCGHACPAACVAGSCQCAAPGGTNLLQNGGFDTNVADWQPLDPNIVLSWSANDAASCATSGALLATNQAPNGLNSGFLQCVAVTAGTSYNAGGWMKVPSGYAHGQAFFQVAWFTGAGCTGTLTLGTQLSQSGNFDVWEPLSQDNLVAPAGTVSAYLYGQIIKNFTDTKSYVVFFDDLYLSPSPGHY